MYRARIYYGGLNSLSEDGLEGDDHYRVVLWPDDEADVGHDSATDQALGEGVG